MKISEGAGRGQAAGSGEHDKWVPEMGGGGTCRLPGHKVDGDILVDAEHTHAEVSHCEVRQEEIGD